MKSPHKILDLPEYFSKMPMLANAYSKSYNQASLRDTSVQLEKIIPGQTPENAVPGRDPEPPYMKFRPDRGNYFGRWTSGPRRDPELRRIRATGAFVPIAEVDVDPLKDALENRNKDEILRIIRKYVQTTGLGQGSHPLEGSVHEVPDGTYLSKGRARVAQVTGHFSELAYPGTTGS